MSTAAPLLQVDRIAKHFGGIKAVDGVTFDLEAGTTLGIIGPNGAGKTALLNCISGVYRINEGSIRFDGKPIHSLRPDRVARKGIVRTFQSTEYFSEFRVLDYVLLARMHIAPQLGLGQLDRVAVDHPGREAREVRRDGGARSVRSRRVRGRAPQRVAVRRPEAHRHRPGHRRGRSAGAARRAHLGHHDR